VRGGRVRGKGRVGGGRWGRGLGAKGSEEGKEGAQYREQDKKKVVCRVGMGGGERGIG